MSIPYTSSILYVKLLAQARACMIRSVRWRKRIFTRPHSRSSAPGRAVKLAGRACRRRNGARFSVGPYSLAGDAPRSKGKPAGRNERLGTTLTGILPDALDDDLNQARPADLDLVSARILPSFRAPRMALYTSLMSRRLLPTMLDYTQTAFGWRMLGHGQPRLEDV